jgi:hypothetical protein
MKGLKFDQRPSEDPDESILSDEDVQQATAEGKKKHSAA